MQSNKGWVNVESPFPWSAAGCAPVQIAQGADGLLCCGTGCWPVLSLLSAQTTRAFSAELSPASQSPALTVTRDYSLPKAGFGDCSCTISWLFLLALPAACPGPSKWQTCPWAYQQNSHPRPGLVCLLLNCSPQSWSSAQCLFASGCCIASALEMLIVKPKHFDDRVKQTAGNFRSMLKMLRIYIKWDFSTWLWLHRGGSFQSLWFPSRHLI